MARALALAALADGRTSPNPLVGCVVLDANGELVGEGYHRQAGEPHAEVMALRRAGDRAKGGTLYVTLEPCCHHGRTPPCSEAVIAAGLRRVVIALDDPDPRVAGGGIAQLKAAGIEVLSGSHRWDLPDRTLENSLLKSDGREAAAEFDLAPLLADLNKNRPLRLQLPGVFNELPVPPFVVKEWRELPSYPL